jgi:hypothetical protein
MVAAATQEGGAADSRRQPPWEESDRGKTFRSLATASRSLGERLHRVLYFDRAPGYSQRRSAFRHVIALRCKCGFAKWTSLIPGTWPHRPMQQIHGLGPFFQYNARGAFRTAAAKIGVHRKPPRYPARNGGGIAAMNETRRLPASPASASAPSPLYVFADSIQYSGTLRERHASSYPRSRRIPNGRQTYLQVSGLQCKRSGAG